IAHGRIPTSPDGFSSATPFLCRWISWRVHHVLHLHLRNPTACTGGTTPSGLRLYFWQRPSRSGGGPVRFRTRRTVCDMTELTVCYVNIFCAPLTNSSAFFPKSRRSGTALPRSTAGRDRIASSHRRRCRSPSMLTPDHL